MPCAAPATAKTTARAARVAGFTSPPLGIGRFAARCGGRAQGPPEPGLSCRCGSLRVRVIGGGLFEVLGLRWGRGVGVALVLCRSFPAFDEGVNKAELCKEGQSYLSSERGERTCMIFMNKGNTAMTNTT